MVRFSRGGRDAVGRGERVDAAVQLARKAITEPNGPADAARRDGPGAVHAELRFGQWLLPALYTRDPACELENREFTPEERPFEISLSDAFEDIQAPRRFIGRCMELRGLDRSLAAIS